jgi:alanine racemase
MVQYLFIVIGNINTKVKNNQSIMAVVKNNAYHYGLEFAVRTFLEAGIFFTLVAFLKKIFESTDQTAVNLIYSFP